MTAPRAPRADSVRNRSAILAAAREQITTHGPEVGMTDIAAAAGVAVGTLYRHFPTKTDLVAAVVAEYVGVVAEHAEATRARVAQGASPVIELTRFLSNVVETSATNHAVKAAAYALGADIGHSDVERRAAAALAEVIEAARAKKQINEGLTVDDLYLLVTTAPTDQPREARDRWLDLVLHGLVRPAARPRSKR